MVYLGLFPDIKEGEVNYRGADKSLARPGREQSTATEGFEFIYPNHNWRNTSITYIHTHIYIYIYKTRLASNEIFFPPGPTQPIVGVYFTALYRALASSRTRLLDHTQRRATVGRTPLNE